MNAKELDTLRHFSSLPIKKQKQFLATCDVEFVKCICECVINILLGNVPISKTKLYRFQSILTQLKQKRLSSAVRRKILSRKKGIDLINTIKNAIIKRLK